MIGKIFQVVLYLAAGVYAVLGIRKIGIVLMHPEGDVGVILLAGFFFLALAAVAASVTFIARKRPGLLVLPALILGVPAAFYFAILGPMLWADEERARRSRQTERTGKEEFGDQPALFAVAQAILKNDPAAIRAAARNVPDLQAAGRDDMTLLYFAVNSTYLHEERVEAVKTLISLGANPNYNNGWNYSFALAHASRACANVLRAMLDGGGDPNGLDEKGVPIIFSNWDVRYYNGTESRPRFALLLERGADINSTMPKTGPCCPDYSLVLYRITKEFGNGGAYADALLLLERGADPNRVANDGMTLAKKLMEHREQFAREKKEPPPDFERLWEWAQTHGILPPPE
jgi:pimeloyl-ACP methyl ester carboxylesterase